MVVMLVVVEKIEGCVCVVGGGEVCSGSLVASSINCSNGGVDCFSSVSPKDDGGGSGGEDIGLVPGWSFEA